MKMLVGHFSTHALDSVAYCTGAIGLERTGLIKSKHNICSPFHYTFVNK